MSFGRRYAPPPVLLSLGEAARWAGRTYSWVRDCIVDGRLPAQRPFENSMLTVSSDDLDRLLERERAAQFRSRTVTLLRPRSTHLRLVVNNDKP